MMNKNLHGQMLLDLTGQGTLGESGPSPSSSSPRFYALPAWAKTHNRGRVAFIRELCKDYGMDPPMRWYTANMLNKAGVAPRDYPEMAKAILKHVQRNIYYTQEAGEQLQSPWRTFDARTGDCDDQTLAICAMAESVGLPWVLALGGTDRKGNLARWVDGTPYREATYTHIYPILGWPSGKPHKWAAAEPTMQVPLGYDVTIHGVDFDHHGRPSPRPVRLDFDGIAMVGPETLGETAPRTAAASQPFSGPTLAPTTRSFPWLLGVSLIAGVVWYLSQEQGNS